MKISSLGILESVRCGWVFLSRRRGKCVALLMSYNPIRTRLVTRKRPLHHEQFKHKLRVYIVNPLESGLGIESRKFLTIWCDSKLENALLLIFLVTLLWVTSSSLKKDFSTAFGGKRSLFIKVLNRFLSRRRQQTFLCHTAGQCQYAWERRLIVTKVIWNTMWHDGAF